MPGFFTGAGASCATGEIEDALVVAGRSIISPVIGNKNKWCGEPRAGLELHAQSASNTTAPNKTDTDLGTIGDIMR
jgi:hypothetical protein